MHAGPTLLNYKEKIKIFSLDTIYDDVQLTERRNCHFSCYAHTQPVNFRIFFAQLLNKTTLKNNPEPSSFHFRNEKNSHVKFYYESKSVYKMKNS